MYIELHASSAFSFLDGASLPEALVDRAAELGYSTLALLDRDGVYGLPRFHLAATRAGLKAIVGAELTIGAGSLRLARQYLTESFVLALAGAALGAAAAWHGTPLMLPFFRTPMQGQGMLIEPDHTVFLVTALSAIATTLFFGAVPAWRATRGMSAAL